MTKRVFIRGKVAIGSLRDNGFKNTAYALAELIDNSIQAKANNVQLLCFEKYSDGERARRVVDKIAVYDNGIGMSAETLYLALEFGESQNKHDAEGMGKFGMGLPNSSISQCTRVDVWSWQSPKKIYHTYLDVEMMKNGELEEIPYPQKANLPEEFAPVFIEGLPESGTFILWSNLDRLQWKTSTSIFRHSEDIVGRMYRNFIEKDRVVIWFHPFVMDRKKYVESEPRKKFRLNDPLYLMKNSSLPDLPGPYEGESFFQIVEDYEYPTEENKFIEYKGKKGKVRIRGSVVKPEIFRRIRELHRVRPGSTIWGKHAAKNFGVSVVRAGRELELKPEFISKGNLKEKARFMGIEVSFKPGLDKVFGVTNNKQHALKFIPLDIEEDAEREGYEKNEIRKFKAALLEDDDPIFYMYDIVNEVENVINKIEKEYLSKLDFSNVEKDDDDKARLEIEKKATEASNERGGSKNPSPFDDQKPTFEGVIETYTAAGYDEETAKLKAKLAIDANIKYGIEEIVSSSLAFFDVTTHNGFALVQINKSHPFYEKIIASVNSEQQSMLELAIAAWARMEQEASEKSKMNLRVARQKWGEVLIDFLTDE